MTYLQHSSPILLRQVFKSEFIQLERLKGSYIRVLKFNNEIKWNNLNHIEIHSKRSYNFDDTY